MKFTLTVDCDNAAFADDLPMEMQEIFNRVVTKLNNGFDESTVLDSNGNTVGSFSLREGPDRFVIVKNNIEADTRLFDDFHEVHEYADYLRSEGGDDIEVCELPPRRS